MESGNTARLKSSIKILEYNVAFIATSEEVLNNELTAKLEDRSRLYQIVDDRCAKVVDLRKRLGAKDGVTRSIVEDL